MSCAYVLLYIFDEFLDRQETLRLMIRKHRGKYCSHLDCIITLKCIKTYRVLKENDRPLWSMGLYIILTHWYYEFLWVWFFVFGVSLMSTYISPELYTQCEQT